MIKCRILRVVISEFNRDLLYWIFFPKLCFVFKNNYRTGDFFACESGAKIFPNVPVLKIPIDSYDEGQESGCMHIVFELSVHFSTHRGSSSMCSNHSLVFVPRFRNYIGCAACSACPASGCAAACAAAASSCARSFASLSLCSNAYPTRVRRNALLSRSSPG